VEERRVRVASARLSLGSLYAPAASLQRAPKPPGKLGVGMDLRRCSPFSYELAEGRIVGNLGCRHDNARELLQEQLPIPGGQELEPGKSVAESIIESLWIVQGEVAQRPAKSGECSGTLSVAVVTSFGRRRRSEKGRSITRIGTVYQN
jgi:hypothetical protein